MTNLDLVALILAFSGTLLVVGSTAQLYINWKTPSMNSREEALINRAIASNRAREAHRKHKLALNNTLKKKQ